jgi:hypothetical protein
MRRILLTILLVCGASVAHAQLPTCQTSVTCAGALCDTPTQCAANEKSLGIDTAGNANCTVEPDHLGQWTFTLGDAINDIPTTSYSPLIVNHPTRTVELSEVCCYANTTGATITLTKKETSVAGAPTAIPTPAACATPGWTGTAGCITNNTTFAHLDSLDVGVTTAAGVNSITVSLPWVSY